MPPTPPHIESEAEIVQVPSALGVAVEPAPQSAIVLFEATAGELTR